MSRKDKIVKPDNISDTVWKTHLNWMGVTSNQADENLKQLRAHKPTRGKATRGA